MLTQTFFKLFPPPKFLNIPFAGLDICDDAVRCIEYFPASKGMTIHRFGTKILPQGTIESGQIKDGEALTKAIADLASEMKLSVVKVSLPEERMYLFKTEIPHEGNHITEKEIRQNVEFKLEENVPLSPLESIFFFDLIPQNAGFADGEGKTLASVSVAPRDLISSYLDCIKKAGLTVVSFEIQAKALARALVNPYSAETEMLVHIMEKKTGIYIVCGGVVCFTSTVSWGNSDILEAKDRIDAILVIRKEIQKILSYWMEHGGGTNIVRIILSGRAAMTDGLVSHCSPDPLIPAEIAQVWKNAFSYEGYIPPVSFEDSLDYAIAAGLAIPALPSSTLS